MKYSNNYNRDFNWYLSMRNTFNFDGRLDRDIIYSKIGIDGKKAFYIFDSQGKLNSTKHPNILRSLIKTKGSVNLHIKMYAQDLAECNWNKIEMRALCIKFKAPSWFRKTVEEQRWKIVFKNK